MSQINFQDFYQVPDLKFDIIKMRADLEKVLKKRNFDISRFIFTLVLSDLPANL